MAPAQAPTLRARFEQWLNDRPDDTVLRALFGVMVTATIGVVALDYRDLAARPMVKLRTAVATPLVTATPLPARRGSEGGEPTAKPDDRLRAPMSFELVADGRLMAVGTVSVGSAQVFAEEIAKRGSYVKAVVLHSPGGSVSDALAMGRLIREKSLATEVESGGYCASSCPLVFAGGTERRAGQKAFIGVHQVSVIGSKPAAEDDGVNSAQRISALCQKYLRDMGIDLQVWVHAMETPKDELYYFKPEELLALKLATQSNDGKKPVAEAVRGRL